MQKTLDDLRKEIDEIDQQILEILVKRVDVVKQIGELKNEHNMPVVDEERREKVLELITQRAKIFHLSEDFVKKLFKEIHDHAVELQKKG
jgi:chorismate mutase